MVKLIILFNQAGRSTPEHHAQYNALLMKLEELPGLRRKVVSTVYSGRGGSIIYDTVVEAYFDDRAALEAALLSPPGTEAGQILFNYALNAVTLFANVMEEDFGGEDTVA